MALFTKRLRKHIFVHPAQQDKLHSAVKSALMRDKRKFSDQLEGALLDVSNPRVIGNHYLIVDGFLSMDVEADFQVFCPTVGTTLEGIVNKKSKGHIGCLVMDLFNASIAIHPNFTINLEVGDTCEFSVSKVIINGEILSLRGSLSETYYEEQTPVSPTKKELKKRKSSQHEASPTETMAELEETEVKNSDLFSNGVLTQPNPNPTSSKKSRKNKSESKFDEDQDVVPPKKRKKLSKSEEQIKSLDVNEEIVSPSKVELNISQDSISSSSHKKRKSHKRESLSP